MHSKGGVLIILVVGTKKYQKSKVQRGQRVPNLDCKTYCEVITALNLYNNLVTSFAKICISSGCWQFQVYYRIIISKYFKVAISIIANIAEILYTLKRIL